MDFPSSDLRWADVARCPEGAILATVVATRGSAYRRPGARMLFLPGGGRRGTVSAGCLENDLEARCQEDGRAQLVIYAPEDADQDLVWGLGLGCRGRVEVLLEPVTPGLRRLADTLEASSGRTRAVAVALQGVTLGHLALDGEGLFQAELQLAVRHGSHHFQAGELKVFCNQLEPRLQLCIFGSGTDVEPVVRLAIGLGWRVRVLDPRGAPRARQRFPDVEQGETAALARFVRGAVVVMTHHFETDRAVLQHLAVRPPSYLGVLGPRQRTEALLGSLTFPAGVLHAPVGLDLGAESPEEVALSIVAEIQARLRGARAGFLRDRPGPIHAVRGLIPA